MLGPLGGNVVVEDEPIWHTLASQETNPVYTGCEILVGYILYTYNLKLVQNHFRAMFDS